MTEFTEFESAGFATRGNRQSNEVLGRCGPQQKRNEALKKMATKQDLEEKALKSLVVAYVGIVCPEMIREKLRIDRARQRAAKKKRDAKLPKKVDTRKRTECARAIGKILLNGPIPASVLREQLGTLGFNKPLVTSILTEMRVKQAQRERPGPIYVWLPENMIPKVRELVEQGDMDSSTASKAGSVAADNCRCTSRK